MELQGKLEKQARAMGATYFGIANLSLIEQGSITPYEEKLVLGFPLAVSIGVPLSRVVVDSIESQSDDFAIKNYWYHVYQMVNPLVDAIVLRLSHIIMEEGFLALAIPSSQTVDREKLYGLFSNKMAASLAGLGWIGKSCLLITPDRGPRVRWGTVLTDAPFSSGEPMKGKGCAECKLCVEACPVDAFTGRPFLPSEPREERMDARKCYRFLFEERKRTIGVSACGLCVYVCPLGRQSSSSPKQVDRNRF